MIPYRSRWPLGAVTLGALLFAAACGSASDPPTPPPAAGDVQTPPTGGAAVEAWLESGDYRAWHCEAAVHGARSPSPHGLGRICSNGALAAATASEGPWPAGAAAV